MELIKITEQDGKQAVSARELHSFLESAEGFNRWIERMFDYGFSENIDYQAVNIFVQASNGVGGTNKKEYVLSLDCAKEISMLQRSDKGKQARKYFIECEKKLKQAVLSPLDLMEYSVKMLKEQSAKLNEFDDRILQLEVKTTTKPDYFTIVGYANLKGITVNLKIASRLGREAARLCKERNLLMDSIPDPRFGVVRLYPQKVVSEVFDNMEL